ncbi:uncharacterized protein L969DRAFT_51062 [Mixia osmundae IAM 14324]|uniref:RRM domain-containing protein n=1 Tax=Mixia osmundae (strain CBS 9802 / IAM 14324 / JCM 22182 / KY 12970) TaxID=764103 RepID=G7DZ87_MIXOS|nr:uncharacterized protein L969DRAFT_51062 [Mixia osmundae IAM 14324]KEI38299.1 hypothetical protein L969DRAFT_51062 [Mixia osmundae IAM 14324]GAA95897.1 hypothetical protein E5Q_02555 [Mixia osmundae IAM 14324]
MATTRLVVKQVQPTTTAEELKKHFSAHLQVDITDSRIASKKDGRSRRIAFLGFATAEQAALARDHYNNTYLSGSKIIVDFAKPRVPTVKQEALVVQEALLPKPEQQAEELQAAGDRSSRSPPSADEAGDDDLAYLTRRLAGRQQEVSQPAEDAVRSASPVPSTSKIAEAPVAPSVAPEDEDTLTTNRLFLRNLAFTVRSSDLQTTFAQHGRVSHVHLVDEDKTERRGLAYVTFETAKEAEQARSALDGTILHGRLLHVMLAAARPGEADQARPGKNSKSKGLLDRRDLAWSSLQMTPDAVMATMADRLGVSKDDLVGRGSENAAVRLALAESQLIDESRTYFAKAGVDLLALNKPGPKSKTMLLVKNIPAGTQPSALKLMFDASGQVKNVLMPPSATLAIVEFTDVDGANKAYKTLAYKRIGNAVLYLERAPLALVNQPIRDDDDVAPSVSAIPEGQPSEQPDENTLYVKNLSFQVTSERLQAMFSDLAGYRFARVQMRKTDVSGVAKTAASLGYGFVGFDTEGNAQAAMTRRQGQLLEGRPLLLARARRGQDAKGAGGEAQESKAGRPTSTLVIKNVPFEVSKKELQALFKSYGNIKSLRMPRKADRHTRGFAFVEFRSTAEAKEAKQALSQTHLLGRHLVIEYGQADQGASLRDDKRPRPDFELPNRRKKFKMGTEDE